MHRNRGIKVNSSNGRSPNLLIIGGGSAGLAGAIKAAELGFSVLIVKKGVMGGTCVNRGCVPSKALIHTANHYHRA